jgi:murein DD-endopeptidase MepM/ murein hydrolase activator NlpD
LDLFFKITRAITTLCRSANKLFIVRLLPCLCLCIPVSAELINSDSKESSVAIFQDSENKKSSGIDKNSFPKIEKPTQTISKPFGEKTLIKKSFSKNPNNPYKGVLLTGGTPSVYPSFSGKIIAVEKLEGYESVVVVDHGDNFYSIYGNLIEVFVAEGDTISKTTLLGNVSKISGLYFQINEGTKSLNPQTFFK